MSEQGKKKPTEAELAEIAEAPLVPQEIVEELEEAQNATWGDVFESCCVHSPQEWGMIAVAVLLLLFFLYFFLLGLELLGTGAKVMTGCRAGSLFGEESNPIAGLMVGILCTVLLQSSSTTTSIVVSLVGSAVTIDEGIYMIMGANIGTSVTNTIVAMGSMGNGDELERAFAGATVHDLFNFAVALILLIVEVITGYLHALTDAIVKNADTREGSEWDGPLSWIVDPLASKIIKENKDVIKAVARGGSCAEFFPVNCTDGIVSADTCSYGLMKCDSDTNECPAFFSDGATQGDDIIAGAVCFIIAIFILFTCLAGLVTVLRKLMLGVSTRIIYKTTNLPGVVAMGVGLGITLIVQSSSITTAVLTPLVGVNVLRLETMFPFTLGANLGTTLTAIMASLVSDNIGSLQVALAHLFFNITGILIFYPIPFMRRLIINGARFLGRMTRIWRGFPIVYIAVMFFLVPLFFLGLSALYMEDARGWNVLGVLITLVVLVAIIYTAYWCYFKDGKHKMIERFKKRERKRAAFADLPDDMEWVNDNVVTLKKKVQMLIDHTGVPEEVQKDIEKQPLYGEASETENDKNVENDSASEEGPVMEVET